MQVLVIGGTRFVGYYLVWRLLAAGHRVTILTRGRLPNPFGDRVEHLKGDRRSPEALDQLSGRSFDATVDFAGYSGEDVRRIVAELGEGLGHYVFISSGQVYLVRQDLEPPYKEDDYEGTVMAQPAGPADREQWEYGVGKRECEDAIVASKLEKTTRLRLPMVNGERDHDRRIESYLWRILDGGPVILPDGGQHRVRHVYGPAVARAIAGLLGEAACFGRAFNLCQQETPRLFALVTMLADILGAPARLAAVPGSSLEAAGLAPRDVSPFSSRWMSFLDPGRAQEELDFHHEPLRHYLQSIVTCFLTRPPAAPPENYAHRPTELLLAQDASLASRADA